VVCADPHPGNIAVDAENGGRLIYYDFGMMGAIPSDVRSGLLELFYGVYEKDPDRSVRHTVHVLSHGSCLQQVYVALVTAASFECCMLCRTASLRP